VQNEGIPSRIKSFFAPLEFLNPASERADTIFQRIWQALPPMSFMIHMVVFFLVPSYKDRFHSCFQAVDSVQRVLESSVQVTLTAEEVKALSSFFSKVQCDPSLFDVLQAGATREQYKTLIWIRGLFNRVDVKALEGKLDAMRRTLDRLQRGECVDLR